MILIYANTMHKVFDQVSAAVSIPLLHVADITATAAQSVGISRVGLLGTRYTMDQLFYRDRLASHGLDVMIPDDDDRDVIHRVIYGELFRGVLNDESRAEFVAVIDRLTKRGAQGVILGCTEIELLISQQDTAVPVFPTTRLHIEAAVDKAIASG